MGISHNLPWPEHSEQAQIQGDPVVATTSLLTALTQASWLSTVPPLTMRPSPVTRQSIFAAIQKHDRLGPDPFLKRYGL